MSKLHCLVLTGGGTGGHVMPNLALLPYLGEDWDRVVYMGETGGVEERLAKLAGLPFWGTRAIKFDRTHPLRNLAIPRVLSRATKQAAEHLIEAEATAVFSKGGYCALPTVLAAHRLGLPIVLHESDYSLGLANRLCRHYTPHLLTAFDTIEGGECVGNPLRRELAYGDPAAIAPLKGKTNLLVFGGSMGASFLNGLACELAQDPTLSVYNVTGKSRVECALPNYHQVPFAPNIQDYYAMADCVVSRAGANTLFELAALGKPCVVVPLPKGVSRGDQVQNARYFASRFGLTVVEQEEATVDRVRQAIGEAISNPPTSSYDIDAVNRHIATRIRQIVTQQ
ncbi:MAG: glycosyltransferase, partial [Clostridia bacterium]|nr:glycosyltransferase [Clostridia bacterium]